MKADMTSPTTANPAPTAPGAAPSPAPAERIEAATLDEIGRAALSVIGAVVIACTPDGRIAHFNRAAENLTGYREDEVLGKVVWDLLIPDDEVRPIRDMFEDPDPARFPLQHQNDWMLPDGSRHCIRWNNAAVFHDDGSLKYVIGTGIDVTAERDALAMLTSLLDATTEQALITTDTYGVIRLFNSGAEHMLGYSAEQMIGVQTPVALHDPEELQARTRNMGLSAGFDALVAAARAGHAETRDWTYRRGDGSALDVAVTVSPLRGPQGDISGFLFVGIDGTDRQRREAALRTVVSEYARRALHDELTGLPNRSLLRDRLEHAIAVAARHDRYVGLLFVDLDGFKGVNDTHGHVAGDELLVKIAARITAAARGSDTVARFGGDEFIVLCEDLHDPAELDTVAERVRAAVEQNTVVGDTLLIPHASVGTVAAPGAGTAPDDLIDQADRAMYESRGLR